MSLTNFVQVQLQSGISAVATSMVVATPVAPYKLPDDSGTLVLLDGLTKPAKAEIVTYTGLTNNGNGTHTFTGLARGAEGSTAQVWSAQAYVIESVTAGMLAALLDAKQTSNANLSAFSALAGEVDRLPYFIGAGALSLATLTAAGRALLAADSQQAQRTILGLVKQSSLSDTTAGALLVNGAHGLDGVNSLGFRNRYQNGDMRVNQRGLTFGDIGETFLYMADRCFTLSTAGNGTLNANRVASNGNFYFKITTTAPNTNLSGVKATYGIFQFMEDRYLQDINGRNITISFVVETNWSGLLAVNLRNANFTRSIVKDVAVVSGVNKVSVTFPIESNTISTNSAGIGLRMAIGTTNEGSLRVATPGVWESGDKLCSMNTTPWTKTINTFISVTDIQFELGAVATPFERLPYHLAVAECRRYYNRTPLASVTGDGAIAYLRSTTSHPTHMRTIPITTVYDAGGTPGRVNLDAGSVNAYVNSSVDYTSVTVTNVVAGLNTFMNGLLVIDAELSNV